jgi:putative endopeptidase
LLSVILLLLPAVGAKHGDAKLPPLWRGLDEAGMDTAVKPWVDFYRFANGKWLDRVELPPDRPAVYVFTLLQDQNRLKLRQIVEAAAKDKQATKESIRGKVGSFYRSGIDVKAIDAAGARPLKQEFDRIDGIRKRDELLPVMARLHLDRAAAGFAFYAAPDAKDSRRMIAQFRQGGLGLPDRDYYLKNDAKTKGIRAAYVDHVGKMLRLLGEDKESAGRHAQTLLDFETRLAKASRSRVELRDPHRNYNLMTVAKMESLTPGTSWKAYFQGLGLTDLSELNVGQPDFLKELGRLVRETSLDDWKVYLRWHLLDAFAGALSAPFVEEDFHFKGTVLQGTPKDRPRWERIVQFTDRLLGEALGQLYVEEAFPPSAKARAEELVGRVKEALRQRLAHLEWMSPATRRAAVKKLDAMAVKIGYPRKWRDYSKLAVDGDVFAVNVLAANEFQTRYTLAKIGKPVDRDEWHMTPPTVNAYYNSSLNEIVFPAGILQPPFFDPQADDAVNYGAFGVVIGHELTHGFDDQGRKYDGAGNLRDWWLPEDERRYKERAARIAAQYDRYTVQGDLHVNGKLTLGENIADLGGVKIAYAALQKALADRPAPKKNGGFTPEQRFFLSFGQVWRAKIRPEVERLRIRIDPHSPPRYRVLGPLYNIPEFFRVFGASAEEAKGHVSPDPVVIW